MAMSWQTAQTKYCHQVHLQGTEIPILTQDTMIDLHPTIITRTDVGLTGQDPIPAVIDREAKARVFHREVAPGHITDAHTEVHCATDTQAHINTPHRRSSSHRSSSAHSRDHSKSRLHTSRKNACMTSSKPSYSSNRTAWKKQG